MGEGVGLISKPLIADSVLYEQPCHSKPTFAAAKSKPRKEEIYTSSVCFENANLHFSKKSARVNLKCYPNSTIENSLNRFEVC